MENQGQLFPDDTSSETEFEDRNAELEQIKAAVQVYLTRVWRTVDLLLESDGGDALFAVARAYYGVYNVATLSAKLLDIDLMPFQSGSDFHIKANAVPHAQMPALVSHLINVLDPPKKLGERTPESRETFSFVRQLQKMRKRADYMGTETLSRDAGRECAQRAKDLCFKLWRITCEHVG